MILADKIIRLRKKNGWSQEELAEKMGVSRQAVSKWEGAQSVPDLGKILQLSTLFGVTTDYLLKDELEDEVFTNGDDDPAVRRVTLAEAHAFLEWRRRASVRIAGAAFLCILAVIPLLLLAAASQMPGFWLSEGLAAGIGLAVLFALVAAAVAVFISCGAQNAPYAFLDKEPFNTEYGVKGMVKETQGAYRSTYTRSNIIGTCLCVLSPVSLLVGACFMDGSDPQSTFALVALLALTMVIAGVGVIFFITAGVRWASMQKLLEEGEFSAQEKKKLGVRESIGTVYWLAATAVYLGWSFATDNWKSTWIVWPIAGVLFAAVMIICNLLADRRK
ncbi:MAG: helix-turn-helix domain-containing protein [Hominenteromicrobium sp.]